MKTLLASLTLALLAQAAHADVASVDFTTRYDGGGVTTTVAPVAHLSLSLNEDGTVTARLDTGADQRWIGVGIDTGVDVYASGMTQGMTSAWGTIFGNFGTGLVCLDGCTGSASWTITGYDGPLSSVQQVLSGNQSDYDAFFYDGIQYAGMATQAAAVPEPASLALLGLGLAGAAVVRRRAKRG